MKKRPSKRKKPPAATIKTVLEELRLAKRSLERKGRAIERLKKQIASRRKP